MDQANNPYAAPQALGKNVVGGECLLVDGNVNLGKDKGQGLLLFTRTHVFAFRANNQAMAVGAATGGLVGALIGYWIEKQRAKKRPPSPHLEDPDIHALEAPIRKKIEQATLLAKLPLGELKIQRTRLGFQLTPENRPPIIYQGFLRKNKVSAFLATLGIDVR